MPCKLEAKEIYQVDVKRFSKNLPLCQNETCKGENGRVYKTESCDIIIKHLRFSDAGKYSLYVYYKNNQTGLKPQITEYQLWIYDENSAKKGKEIKLHVLLANAEKVLKNGSGVWIEVWNRNHGVENDHLTDSDGSLIIKEFTDSDVGTYRVLDHKGNTLITVRVTEFTESGPKDELGKDDDNWTLPAGVSVSMILGLVALSVVLYLVIKKYC